MKPVSRLPSHGTVVAYAALFVALGGTTYAAMSVRANSVGTKQLKNGAVTSAKVRAHSLTGHDIRASSLGKVPLAASADNAQHATAANTASEAAHAATATNADQLGNRPASGYATLTPLMPTPPTLENDWVSGPQSGVGAPGFAKDDSGIVHLFGDALQTEASTPSAIFTLPEGDRPAYRVTVPVRYQTALIGLLEIDPDGTVTPTDTTTEVGLEGVTFRAG